MNSKNRDLQIIISNHQINKIKDTSYLMEGYRVPYHYHRKGFETLFVEAGRIEVIINGQKLILDEGDVINFEPFCPHAFKILAADTVIREIYTAFEQVDNYFEMPDLANCIDVNKEDVQSVVVKGEGRHIFKHEGIKFLQKIARYQLGGYNEIWEYQIDCGYKLNFNGSSHNEGVFYVRNGEFQIEINGEIFTAGKDKDSLIRIPANTPYSIKALTDECILHDYNVSTHLFRLLEMLEAAEDYFSEKLQDKEYIEYLFDVNKLNNFIDFNKAEGC